MARIQREGQFTVDCGDAEFYFRFGRELKASEVDSIFEARIQHLRHGLLPGLRLADEQGQLWKPLLRIQLVPADND